MIEVRCALTPGLLMQTGPRSLVPSDGDIYLDLSISSLGYRISSSWRTQPSQGDGCISGLAPLAVPMFVAFYYSICIILFL